MFFIKKTKKKSIFNITRLFFLKKKKHDNKIIDEIKAKFKNGFSVFSEIYVSDIMVTRKKIFALPINTTKKELLLAMQDNHYTRIPIYKGELDDIVGFIHIKDIISNINDDFNITDIMRNIMFVPTSMKAMDLLIKMQGAHIHVGIVLDEYGGTEGLVTIVNIIEKIVGDIDDEHDEDTDPILKKISNGKFEVEGGMQIVFLESALNIKFNTTEDLSLIHI